MDRRSFLALALAALPVSGARAATPPAWRARLLAAGLRDGHYRIGLAITLEPDWKTYWRVPGDGGVPPEITVTGANLGDVAISHPLPHRFATGEGGETIGYKDEVVFPITVTPKDAGLPLALRLKAFFGVCKGICIPAEYEADLVLDPARPGPDTLTLALWQAKVPEVAAADQAPVTAARLDPTGARPHLVLTLRKPVADIFVEAAGEGFFHAPDFAREAGTAWLAIADLKDVNTLKGQTLRITLDDGGQGLEQSLTIP